MAKTAFCRLEIVCYAKLKHIVEHTFMTRAYYSNQITAFLNESQESILGKLAANHRHQVLEHAQNSAWQRQITILKAQLAELEGRIYFEFAIPRMGKRVDNIVILGQRIFVLEFKIGATSYDKQAIEQVVDYVLDLHHFHEGSHDIDLIPVLIAEKAKADVIDQDKCQDARDFRSAICVNAENLGQFLHSFPHQSLLNVEKWEQSAYKPTPTIVEAAQALYQSHDVQEITRSDAGAENLSITAHCINQIIERAKATKQKAICFITGVPGAGKTLAGLNIANQRLQMAQDEHAVFLSGNGPLVKVLQEALARNVVGRGKSKKEALKETKAFIQNIHHFRDEYLKDMQAPTEKVVVFDEAQRAWNKEQASKFMNQKRGLSDFNQSEPEFLIDVMNRHQDWCVIVCLIGGGQEINTGEAGLSEWIMALKENYTYWQVHYSDLIVDEAHYLSDLQLKQWLKECGQAHLSLHLAVSIRSFRSEKVSAFVHALLVQHEQAKSLYQEVSSQYPIVLTRDLAKAKSWLIEQAKGSERYGLIASSGARRLKALGVNVKNEIEVENWFLNGKDDVRASYFLEDVATEFDVQGLELDWACVAWGGNFYYHHGQWQYQNFKGSKWQNVNKADDRQYIQNAHRVLLTRARQGMVIWIPEGSKTDDTRKPCFYDGTYQYLRSLNIEEL